MVSEFLNAMRAHLPRDARLMACQFRGDPAADCRGKWRARVLDNDRLIDPEANVYLCVSAMKRNARGEWRRRKENFAGGLLLMVDDLGEGPGSKFPLSKVAVLPPTALVETSPGNFQAVYMFSSLVTDLAKFDALIRAFIAAQFLGQDTGMAGVNRVFRPPAGVNGKPKYNGWHVRLADWHPQNRYSVEQIAAAFGLVLQMAGPRVPRGATEDKAELIRHFVHVRTLLRSLGMVKRETSDVSGWQDVRCPWTDSHTDAKDNGAALRVPDEENGWHGAFRCHHGSCQGRGWRELTDWIAASEADVLADINARHKDFRP